VPGSVYFVEICITLLQLVAQRPKVVPLENIWRYLHFSHPVDLLLIMTVPVSQHCERKKARGKGASSNSRHHGLLWSASYYRPRSGW